MRESKVQEHVAGSTGKMCDFSIQRKIKTLPVTYTIVTSEANVSDVTFYASVQPATKQQ